MVQCPVCKGMSGDETPAQEEDYEIKNDTVEVVFSCVYAHEFIAVYKFSHISYGETT